MARLPLCSSREVISALRRLGFAPVGKTGGSHQTYYRIDRFGARQTATVIRGERDPRGTLQSILNQGQIAVKEFLDALR